MTTPLPPPGISMRGGAPIPALPPTSTGQRAVGTPSGPVLFARYAFGPNRLGLCGSEDWRGLLELGVAGASLGRHPEGEPMPPSAAEHARARDVERGLRDLASRFEGAYPYLELIARAHGIADPMDRRVVDAYWIGNALSDRVEPGLLGISMRQRFRDLVTPDDWRWLEGKPAAGAHPTHAFHVFDVFPRVGLLRGGAVTNAMGLMDSCRIRWGRVLEVSGDSLVVAAVPLRLDEGRLALGDPRPQTVRRWLDGSGFVSDVAVGDIVSLHWDWACEVLGPARLRALRTRTLHQLALANQTL